MKKWLAGVAVVGSVVYPLVVYFGLSRFQPRYIAIFLGLLVLVKLAVGNISWRKRAEVSGPARIATYSRVVQIVTTLVILVLVLSAIAGNEAFSLKFYPAVINFSLLAGFGWSLLHPPSVIERIARMSEPQLPAAGVRYTRRLTLVWCGFFLCNGLAALYTALYSDYATWAFYNGLIAYVLSGCLLGGELLYRHTHMKKQDDAADVPVAKNKG